ncbi:MAG: hypothetical protein KDE62_02100, partial [Calditrichaeota bacterium]|nr:hypothetical protein [Calditrichota bacterium]
MLRTIFAWGKAHGAWGDTVRVSGLVLAQAGAMPYAPCESFADYIVPSKLLAVFLKEFLLRPPHPV